MKPQSLSAVITGMTILLYWSRVARMAYKTRRRTGNAANFLPPEPLGRLLRILWIPAVGLWIAAPFMAAARTGLDPFFAPLYRHEPFTMIAATLALLCFAGSWVCWKRMGKSWRMGISPGEKTRLIVTGPYAYVRHPIYALSSLMMLATIAAVPSPVLIAAGVVHIVLLQWESRREEHYLLQIHGDPYNRYRQHVGRFFPASFTAYTKPALEETPA
jgi:protein-S-isoprenylcysteine O-methyltransferase Ste14